MKVGLQGSFGKDEREYNGLEKHAKHLIDAPLARLTIVAVVERSRVVINDREGGEATPTVRLVHVEVVDGEDEKTVKNILEDTFRRRTGRSDGTPPTLFDPDNDDGPDPTAGPWPGDADYVPAGDPDATTG